MKKSSKFSGIQQYIKSICEKSGNSPTEFYVGPETTGGLPIEWDNKANNTTKLSEDSQEEKRVTTYKDNLARLKRQAARFRIFEYDDKGNEKREVTLGNGIDEIKWTVHIANKKAVWYTFSQLQGNLTFGEWNSYKNQNVPLNNPNSTDRQKLIIDPGPRQLDSKNGTGFEYKQDFSLSTPPSDYNNFNFPELDSNAQASTRVETLGSIFMDSDGRLIAIGGLGVVQEGSDKITTFRGAPGYFDDIADGYVTATVTVGGKSYDLEPAWLIVGSPKVAPELVNIVTLDDIVFDVAVRYFNYDESIYQGTPPSPPDTQPTLLENPDPKELQKNLLTNFKPNYEPDYTEHIEPIIERPQSYRWVANVPSMIEFSNPKFDTTDKSSKTQKNRQKYFNYFRIPVPPELYQYVNVVNGPNQLFYATSIDDNGKNVYPQNQYNQNEYVPLMPLNSGDNSIVSNISNDGQTNQPVYKFLTLTPTQYFFLSQWSNGKFKHSSKEQPSAPPKTLTGKQIDSGVLSNCVGAPCAPGIEVTWLVRNPELYHKAYQLKVAHYQYGDSGANQELINYYNSNGLSTTEDEGEGAGCEPGDLTKRMAIPWQADFFECTVQTPSIVDPSYNQDDGTGIQSPPIYYVYWWPPQSPYNTFIGTQDGNQQVLEGLIAGLTEQIGQASITDGSALLAAGQQVLYHRGITGYNSTIENWNNLGFIVNQGTEDYPYFVEQERNTNQIAQSVFMNLQSVTSNNS